MYEKEYILFYTRRKRMNTKLSAIQYMIIAFIYGWSGLAQRPRYFKYKLPEAATRLTSGSHAAQRKGAAKTCCGFSSYRNFILLKTGVFFSNCLMKPTKRIYTPGFLKQDNTNYVKRYEYDIIICKRETWNLNGLGKRKEYERMREWANWMGWFVKNEDRQSTSSSKYIKIYIIQTLEDSCGGFRDSAMCDGDWSSFGDFWWRQWETGTIWRAVTRNIVKRSRILLPNVALKVEGNSIISSVCLS